MTVLSGALPSARGTYCLCLRLSKPIRCAVGALGEWDFPKGYYLYVGSAWGPGGLRARVGRHLRGTKSLRWHVDYLRQHTSPAALWLAPGEHLECDWAHHLDGDPDAHIVVPRFGASDCDCPTHLFLYAGCLSALHLPGLPQFINLLVQGDSDEALS